MSLADLYIFCSFSNSWEAAALIPSQLAFLKWKHLLGFCWVLYGLMHKSVMTASWSERPGMLTEALVREGRFVVKTRSKWFPCHVGNSWIWVGWCLRDTSTSFSCADLSLAQTVFWQNHTAHIIALTNKFHDRRWESHIAHMIALTNKFHDRRYQDKNLEYALYSVSKFSFIWWRISGLPPYNKCPSCTHVPFDTRHEKCCMLTKEEDQSGCM